MYQHYFGFKESPFSIAPDPSFIYLSVEHENALLFLMAALKRETGGLFLFTGEVGAGKTTLCRQLLRQLPEGTETAMILNPRVSADELLETICDELRLTVGSGDSAARRFSLIKEYLFELSRQGRQLLLLIDEAQGLADEVFEQLRLLATLSDRLQLRLVIILLGQPELAGRCRLLPAFDQRIAGRFHLPPLKPEDISVYVAHRLRVAGCDRLIFTPRALEQVCSRSGGIPRLVNLICDRALLAASALDRRQVDAGLVRQAADEVFGGVSLSAGKRRSFKPAWVVLPVLLLLLVWAGFSFRLETNRSLATESAVPLPLLAPPAQTDEVVAEPEWPQSWPEGFAFATTETKAYAALFALWGQVYDPRAPDPCRFARQNHLECYAKKATLSGLRKLDRPAILIMYRDNGEPFYVVLAGLDERRARLLSGDGELTVDVRALEPRWFGESLLVWSSPLVSRELLVPGGSNVNIIWLEDAMMRLGLYAGTADVVSLDGLLLSALKRFQVAAGLVPDGILGPETMIHLNTAGQVPGPRLSFLVGE